MKEKYGFVYIWYDRKHKKFYIGCHWGTEDDGYVCSSRHMKNAHRRRPQDFKRRILISNISSREELFLEEYRFLSSIKVEELGKRYYNLSVQPPDHHWSTDQQKYITVQEKVSRSWTPERRARHKEVMSVKSAGNASKRGAKLNEEQRKRISDSKKGHTYNTGKPKSEETKRKIAEALKQHYKENIPAAKGRVVSEETREKMAAAKRGRSPWNKGKVGPNKGVSRSEETKEKMRKPKSDKAKANMKLAWEIRRAKKNML